LRGALDALQLAGAVEHDGERPLRDELRVELLECARRGVARVGESRLARGLALLVEFLERDAGIINFAAQLEHRRVIFDGERQVLDRPQILRDVVTGLPIAARRALHELAFFVAHADGNAVDFGLDLKADFFALERLLYAVDEGLELARRIGVVEALHRDGMAQRSEMRQRCAADALAGRVAHIEFRMRRLEIEQIAVNAVVLLVGDKRLRFRVVGLVQLADFLHQLAMFFGDGHLR
jgi:hypothetical protein